MKKLLNFDYIFYGMGCLASKKNHSVLTLARIIIGIREFSKDFFTVNG